MDTSPLLGAAPSQPPMPKTRACAPHLHGRPMPSLEVSSLPLPVQQCFGLSVSFLPSPSLSASDPVGVFLSSSSSLSSGPTGSMSSEVVSVVALLLGFVPVSSLVAPSAAAPLLLLSVRLVGSAPGVRFRRSTTGPPPLSGAGRGRCEVGPAMGHPQGSDRASASGGEAAESPGVPSRALSPAPGSHILLTSERPSLRTSGRRSRTSLGRPPIHVAGSQALHLFPSLCRSPHIRQVMALSAPGGPSIASRLTAPGRRLKPCFVQMPASARDPRS